jgi:23S rRNA pseudouridine1911/1915/1917 synthase
MNKIKIDSQYTGQRLDSFLSTVLKDLSRNQIQRAIRLGQVVVNNSTAKPSQILKVGDLVEYEISKSEKELPLAERGDIEIIFENSDFMIVNKPADLVVHPAHANKTHTLVNYLLKINPVIAEAVYDPSKQVSVDRPGIVHRLDKDTSGLLIVAKNKESLQKLSRLIHGHHLEKKYMALVYGTTEKSGTIETFLKRSDKDRRKMEISKMLGKEAITEYLTVSNYKYQNADFSLLELTPVTGRTHQLRVHLKSIGHPVIGDQTYYSSASKSLSDKLGIKRQLLHAKKLSFRYNKETYDFNLNVPEDFQKIIEKLEII